ncbi:hypothetical protein ABZP36_031389 [Zizania latifolia]
MQWSQEKLERKKAEYMEKMRNQGTAIHKATEEKRTTIEAKQHEEMISHSCLLPYPDSPLPSSPPVATSTRS